MLSFFTANRHVTTNIKYNSTNKHNFSDWSISCLYLLNCAIRDTFTVDGQTIEFSTGLTFSGAAADLCGLRRHCRAQKLLTFIMIADQSLSVAPEITADQLESQTEIV